jgi:hypothetical protein
LRILKFKEEIMAEILQFPQGNNEEFEKLVSEFVNQAVCDSTDELLIDGHTIEGRIAKLCADNTMQNKVAFISGLCAFSDAYIIGDDDTWMDYKLKQGNFEGYAVFTDIDKVPADKRRRRQFTSTSFRYMIGQLEGESGKIEFCLNPNEKNSYIISLELLRVSLELYDKASDFTDDLMKKGLKAESLTDVLFERFDYRLVEITLKNGTKLSGQVECPTFGDDPNAHYELTADDKTIDVFRKDIAFIKEI